MEKYFKPEFLNRLDDVIVFRPLTEESLLSVAELLIQETVENLGRKSIALTFAPELPDWLRGHGQASIRRRVRVRCAAWSSAGWRTPWPTTSSSTGATRAGACCCTSWTTNR